MGRIKKIVALGLVAISSIAFAGCSMIEKTPEAIKNETLAKVGDQKITRGDLDKTMTPIYAQYEQQYGSDFKNNAQIKQQLLTQEKQQLEALVDEKVILVEAEKQKWVPSEETLNKAVDEQLKQFKKVYNTDDSFKQFYQSYGFQNEDELKAFLKNQEIVKTVLKDHVYKDIKVTDADAKKYYDENKASTYTVKPGADVYNIVLPDEKTAKEVRAELVSGKAKFADMAAKYNTDSTKTTGGSLGYINYDSTQYLPEFMDAMKKLKDGEISQPVKTKFGYHLIKVENVKSKAEVIPFDKVKDSIKQQLDQSKKNTAYKDAINKWKDEIGVKVYEDKIQKK